MKPSSTPHPSREARHQRPDGVSATAPCRRPAVSCQPATVSQFIPELSASPKSQRPQFLLAAVRSFPDGAGARITVGANANTIASQYDYTVNSIGQRTARSQSGSAFVTASTDTFSYNPRNEVTGSTNNQIQANDRAYSYDSIGNRLNVTEGLSTTPAVAKTYTSNVLNQYTQIQTSAQSVSSAVTPTYDDDGNMLTDGSGKTYQWDCENRLIQVSLPNSEIVKYDYDGNSRRIKREHITSTLNDTTTYLYDGWNVIYEANQKSQISNNEIASTINSSKSYIWGLDLSNSLQGAGGVGGLLATKTTNANLTQSHFHIYDASGNTSELVDTSGIISAHYEYDAFGKETIVSGSWANNNAYRFSTKSLGSVTGLNYYGYRFYQVSEGRWINRDSIGETGGLNLYKMVDNDVLNNHDFLGNEKTTQNWDDYWNEWKKNHPGLTPEQYTWAEKELARGCVGISAINLGSLDAKGMPDTSNCYKKKEDADKEKKKKCDCPRGRKPAIFSIHLWNDTGINSKKPDVSFDAKTGKANLENWDWQPRPRSTGAPLGANWVNFDFGWLEADGSITHADRFHNPDKNKDNIGDYYPKYKIRDATIYHSDLSDWQRSNADFNTEVWCVACDGGNYGGGK
jgi:RHS repeat-associated protein